MAEEGSTIVIIIGYLLAVLEAFPLGIIFALVLYFLTDNEYYKYHGKYMLIISVVITVLILVFFGGMILTLLGMSAASNAAAPIK
ncbi:MAG: hypothetical protein E7Z74_07420 [Methanobrevibacter millerae]|uniref:Uncharacterized protein n=1 Tax=Methanobrevibacter millerae TaxID=230361 RepID=A0A8T3VT45_9EURY|nr:hypothetical protein [Methanobrevibacter millerae]